MMHQHWGSIPEAVWVRADEKYGLKTVYAGLETALDFILTKHDQALRIAVDSLNINSSTASLIVGEYAQKLLSEIINRKNTPK